MKLSFWIKKVKNQPNDKLLVVGNIKSLGHWNLDDALKMDKLDDSSWQSKDYITVNPQETLKIEYKYVMMNENDLTTSWENGDNRKFDLNMYFDRLSDPTCVI